MKKESKVWWAVISSDGELQTDGFGQVTVWQRKGTAQRMSNPGERVVRVRIEEVKDER